MFGHQNQQDEDNHMPDDQSVTPDKPAAANGADWQHPGTPLDNDDQPSAPPIASADKADDSMPDNSGSDDAGASDDSKDSDDKPMPHTYSPVGSLNDDHDDRSAADNLSGDDLVSIKQQALGKLSPLVGHLDQTPEEKFRTTMMMIQASDNQGLIKTAYDAAQEIDDEKARAQALLDVINEINYFTQPKDKAD